MPKSEADRIAKSALKNGRRGIEIAKKHGATLPKAAGMTPEKLRQEIAADILLPVHQTGLEDMAADTIRVLIRRSGLPAEKLIEIARQEQQASWGARETWAASAVNGDKAKPVIEARSGPSLSTEELAKRLRVTTQTVRNMKERASLVGYHAFTGSNGLRFPLWQFSSEGGRLAVKSWVVQLLAAYKGNGWGLLDFMTVPRPSHGGVGYLASTERGADAVREVIEAAARSNPD